MTIKSVTPTQQITPPPENDAPLRPRRQPKWIIGGVLSMALGALGAAWLWQQATGTQQVVYVARPIAVGQVIGADDLTTVQVGNLPNVATVPGDQLNSLLGQQATVSLAGGTLLPGGVIGELPLDASESQLGLRLASGRLPTTGLEPGAMVSIVALPDPAINAGASDVGTGDPGSGDLVTGDQVTVPARLVTAPTRDEDGLSWLVDVALPTQDAEHIARLAAGDRVAIVLEGR